MTGTPAAPPRSTRCSRPLASGSPALQSGRHDGCGHAALDRQLPTGTAGPDAGLEPAAPERHPRQFSPLITGVYARSDRNERPPMPVSHARATTVTSTDERAAGDVPGLLEVLALVPDTRKARGRRFALAFMLAVAVACVLAGPKSFREIGDQAADLPQEVLARLGGKPRPLLRRIIAPSE